METSNQQLKSEMILDELRKKQRSKEVVDVEEERIKIVVFTCGEKRYAFHGSNIREILPISDISWLPCLQEYLPGLINVRGDIESVIDIRYFLGEGNCIGGKQLIALAVSGDFHSGILIDSIEDVLDIPLSTIHPPLATLNGAARDLVAGEIDFRGGTISLLDVGKLSSLITV